MKDTRIELLPFLMKHTPPQDEGPPLYGFRLDLEIIKAAVIESNMEDRIFYWMPRPCGGVCVKERNVFLRDSDDYRIWTTLEQGAVQQPSYHITLTGGRPRNPIGSVRTFDYTAQLRRLPKAALDISALELTFRSGEQLILPVEEYRRNKERFFTEYGTVRRLRYLPQNEAELNRAILMEHRYQKGWQPKRNRQTPGSPAR